MKNPLTPAGIEPATFRFVAQHLNHCATAVPPRVPQNAQFNAQMNSEVVSPRPWVHFHIRLDNDITSTPVLDSVYNNEGGILVPKPAHPSVRSLIK